MSKKFGADSATLRRKAKTERLRQKRQLTRFFV
jgi:hypothetical protein